GCRAGERNDDHQHGRHRRVRRRRRHRDDQRRARERRAGAGRLADGRPVRPGGGDLQPAGAGDGRRRHRALRRGRARPLRCRGRSGRQQRRQLHHRRDRPDGALRLQRRAPARPAGLRPRRVRRDGGGRVGQRDARRPL
ncbi:MAG: hypothetical protein AVDCRST_MAG39-1345, partial [uncultured Sphingomonadaceae bacterium]